MGLGIWRVPVGATGRGRRLWARGTRCAAALLSATAMTGALLVQPVAAEIEGGCSASINGKDVRNVSSSEIGQAITVQQGSQVTVTMDSPSPITQLQIFLEFAGARIPVVSKPTSGSSVRETVPVDQYATHGVGLYKVIGSGSGGQTCSGAALVNVEGDPLQTTAGKVAAGVAAVGALGVLGAAGGAAFGGPRGLGWRPRISGIGLLGGLLAGFGGLVLAQQFGVAYPTLVATLVAVVGGGAGGGLVLPSLAKLLRL